MLNRWLFLVLASALIDWVFVWRKAHSARCVTKPLAMATLILCLTVSSAWQGAMRLLGLALIFSLAGDVFLLERMVDARRTFFVFGLGSFFIAHVLYIWGINRMLPPIGWATLLTLAAVGAVATLIARPIVNGLSSHPRAAALKAPVVVYVAVLALMLFSALITLLRPDWGQAGRPACGISAPCRESPGHTQYTPCPWGS